MYRAYTPIQGTVVSYAISMLRQVAEQLKSAGITMAAMRVRAIALDLELAYKEKGVDG
jgi:hypothetical protein